MELSSSTWSNRWKNMAITAPMGSGSEYYNYKKHHSMVLMAIVDAQYQFIL